MAHPAVSNHITCGLTHPFVNPLYYAFAPSGVNVMRLGYVNDKLRDVSFNRNQALPKGLKEFIISLISLSHAYKNNGNIKCSVYLFINLYGYLLILYS